MTDYFYKYQKYKQKYLNLTNQLNQTGGKRDYPIIHIRVHLVLVKQL